VKKLREEYQTWSFNVNDFGKEYLNEGTRNTEHTDRAYKAYIFWMFTIKKYGKK